MSLRGNSNYLFIFIILLHLFPNAGNAQCTNPINTFPYNENFENSNGNWSRSAALHWDWGSIVPGSKQIITAAGQGQKCWIVGGLSGANYSSGNSYITSPCFDFSSLVNPEISFKVIWETEYNYDGVHLEYSTDQGNSWAIVGSQNSNATCEGENWYNSSSIRFLNYTPAWSGSVLSGSGGNCANGGGSGQWLRARHKLTSLAGLNKVIFRFAFGAGTVCNDYEGFAIDDISINEIAPATADFTYTCAGNNAVNFVTIASYCQTSVSWNFGDALSGTANVSPLSNPSHIFSAPGNYTVTQTVNFSNGPSLIKTATINILGVSPVITQSLLCNGDQNGSITANVSGGNGNYSYSWNTNPVQQSQTITNLEAGTYTVIVTEPNSCQASSSVSIIEPDPIAINATITDATCNLNNGNIQTIVTGGTGAYTYWWSDNETTVSLNNIGGGNYSLQVTDANGCVANTPVLVVNNNIVPALIHLGNDTTICPGQTLLLQPGNFSSYLWQDNSVSPTFLVTESGMYTVEVTNNAGCKAADEITVTVDCKDVYFPSSFTPNGDRINDGFGPVGDVGSLSDYSLMIFNRWGQLIFKSNNPLEKWNGFFKGKISSLESFVWVSSYTLYGKKFPNRKGTVTLIK